MEILRLVENFTKILEKRETFQLITMHASTRVLISLREADRRKVYWELPGFSRDKHTLVFERTNPDKIFE